MRKSAMFFVFAAAFFVSGCATYRDLGALAGAAVGAEANRNYPIRGAVAGGIIGALAGAFVDRVYGPVYGSDWRTTTPRGRYWSHDGEGTRCDIDSRTDYRTGGVVVTRHCMSQVERPVPGGTEYCNASFEARSTNGGPFVVVRDDGHCRVHATSGGYRNYPR